MEKKLSKKTGEFIEKNMKEEINEIVEDVKVKEIQSKNDLNKFIYAVGVLGPILALFQAFKIFSLHTAAGVSMIYWGAYLAVAAMWLGYGVYYRNKPIVIVYGLWIAVEIVIINGIYFYS